MAEKRKMNPNSLKNLKPFSEMSEEEAKEVRSKGGKASAEKKRYKKNLSECAKILLSAEVSTKKDKEMIKNLCQDEEASNGMLLIANLFKQANKGSTRAAQLIKELAMEGETPEPDTSLFEAIVNGMNDVEEDE